jgi:hypothetical protein
MKGLLSDTARLLFFRLDGAELASLRRGHLYLGLVATWLAGMGRYWDHPKAELAQRLGLGSLGYIILLALLLWCVLRPVVGAKTGYWNLLAFISLTSPPAWLYAIPVERFTGMDTAIMLNIWFLAIVAGWRVALLLNFVRRNYALAWWRVVVCCLLPITAIIFLLAALNLEHAVFEIMGGLQSQRSPGDGAYGFIVLLALLSFWLFPVLLLVWLWLVADRLVRARRAAKPAP